MQGKGSEANIAQLIFLGLIELSQVPFFIPLDQCHHPVIGRRKSSIVQGPSCNNLSMNFDVQGQITPIYNEPASSSRAKIREIKTRFEVSNMNLPTPYANYRNISVCPTFGAVSSLASNLS